MFFSRNGQHAPLNVLSLIHPKPGNWGTRLWFFDHDDRNHTVITKRALFVRRTNVISTCPLPIYLGKADQGRVRLLCDSINMTHLSTRQTDIDWHLNLDLLPIQHGQRSYCRGHAKFCKPHLSRGHNIRCVHLFLFSAETGFQGFFLEKINTKLF